MENRVNGGAGEGRRDKEERTHAPMCLLHTQWQGGCRRTLISDVCTRSFVFQKVYNGLDLLLGNLVSSKRRLTSAQRESGVAPPYVFLLVQRRVN